MSAARKTTIPTREELERQAADLNAQLNAIREREQAEQQAEQQRQAEAAVEADRQAVAAYSPRALDVEVQQARQAFDAALADTPLVRALADYTTALYRRRYAAYDHVARLDRLGRPTAGAVYPNAEIGPVEDNVAAAVARLVREAFDTERNPQEAS